MRPRPSGEVIYKDMSEGGVLLHTGQEVYFGLNEVGSPIWAKLTNCDSFDELCEAIEAKYPEAEGETVRTDIRELLDQLVEFGLLIPAGAFDEPKSAAAPVA
jgi:hypothetical protein